MTFSNLICIVLFLYHSGFVVSNTSNKIKQIWLNSFSKRFSLCAWLLGAFFYVVASLLFNFKLFFGCQRGLYLPFKRIVNCRSLTLVVYEPQLTHKNSGIQVSSSNNKTFTNTQYPIQARHIGLPSLFHADVNYWRWSNCIFSAWKNEEWSS